MIDSILGFFGSTLEDVIGGGVLWLIDILLSFLPNSPFLTLSLDVPEQGLNWLNWFVDLRGMLDFLALWLAAVMLYMVLHKVLEVVHGIDGIKGIIGNLFVSSGS